MGFFYSQLDPKNRLNKNGQTTIMVRITLSGDISQFSSKLELEPHLWDTKAGKAAGKSFKIVNNYACNRSQPSLVTLHKIAKILQVDAKELIK